MEGRSRSYRRHKERSKWVRRIKYWMLQDPYIFDNNGKKIYSPSISQCLDTHRSKIYKNTGTPCSCYMCSYGKYDRNEAKKEAKFLLNNAA